MSGPDPVRVLDAIATLTFLADRTPHTTEDESADSFAQLRAYRDGGIYVGHWAGTTEWERHSVADEIVMILDGETTIFFLTEIGEASASLRGGDLVVVPRDTWHRFETPTGVKILSVTPQPTDHSPTAPR